MKRWFRVQRILVLALVLSGPVSAQASCFFSSCYTSCSPCYTSCYSVPCCPTVSYCCPTYTYCCPTYTCPTYTYQAYAAPVYYYPTYTYPVYPTYYSVPQVTVGPVIASRTTENAKVATARQPMLKPSQTTGTASEAKPEIAPPSYRDLHRKLLVKYRTAADVPVLVAKAIAAYQEQDYQEALDLSWAAVQLDQSDARAWYSKAANELALGLTNDARASAERGAFQERLGQKGSLESLMFRAEHRQVLANALARMNSAATPRLTSLSIGSDSIASLGR